MEHRKTPVGRALTLPGWAIIVAALICLAAAAYYVVLLVGGSGSGGTTDTHPTVTTATTPAPTTPAQTTPAPTAATSTAPKPSASPTTGRPANDAARDIPVGVYNNTSTSGLARSVAAKVQAAGWQVSRIANWRGVIPETTVYYPAGFQAQAALLARDLDFGRVRPATASMATGQLTLVLSGQQ